MTACSPRPKLGLDDFARADHATRRREDAGLTFRSVLHALQWHAEAGPRMQSPVGLHPRSQRARDGSQVIVDVQGGRGSSLDEVLATLTTIHGALAEALRYEERGTAMLLRVAQGETMTEIGRDHHVSQQQVSVEVGRATAYLAGRLGAAGVVR